MSRLTGFAIKVAGAGGAATLLVLGAAGVLAQAASPAPTPAAGARAAAPATEAAVARRAIRGAVLESEADVLGLAPKALRADLRGGRTVAELAQSEGITESQFETKLVAALHPRLQTLVDHKVITQAQAGRTLDRISKGRIPFWNGIHTRP
jgi:hypothetical protein